MKNNYVVTKSLLVMISLNVFIAIFLSQFAAAATDPASTAATISKFNLKDDRDFTAYKQKFQIPPSQIASITNNGGKYASSTIDKAIDGDVNTFWETGKPNSATFINEVIITFTDVVDLNRIAYATRQDGAKPKGYPTNFEVYGNTDGSNNFKLAASGSSSAIGELMEFKFATTAFKKLKFVFVEANQGWASASEFWFMKEDAVLDGTQGLFTDRTHAKLVANVNMDHIQTLEAQAVGHPFQTNILHDLEDAKMLIDNPNAFNRYTSIMEQKVSPSVAAGVFPKLNTYQPTGLYALPGQTIRVYVEATDGGKLPSIIFTQNQGSWDHFERSYPLAPGLNTFTTPLIYKDTWENKVKKGGPIYFSNYYSSADQPVAPKIRVEGAAAYPVYKEGGDEQAFINELKDYNVKLDADHAAGTNQVLDIAEVSSANMLITTTTKGAVEAFINQNIKPSDTAAFWNDFVMIECRLAGMDGSLPIHDPTNVHTNIRIMQPYGGMYAAGNHIGVWPDQESKMLNPEYIKKSPWGYAHELGHQLDNNAADVREWGEVTNNVQSANMSNLFNPKEVNFKRLPYDTYVYPNVAPNARLMPYTDGKHFENLPLFWQLQLFDNTYWAKVNKLYRERRPTASNEQGKRDLFIKYSSEALNLNLGEYFRRHGWNASGSVLTEIAAYPAPDKKIWYLNDTVLGYTGDVSSATVTPNLSGYVNLLASNAVLSFHVDPIYANDVLGYEIVRGDQVVGFTTTNNFTEVNNDYSNNGTYTIKVYDKKLNVIGSESIDVANYSTGYLSDAIWVSATTGWSTIKKDKSIDGNALTALNNGVKTTYAKGIGTHANSTIIYNLTNKDAAYFESYIAVDKEMGSGGSVVFEVWADGVKVFNSGIMKASTNAQFVKIPIRGVKVLKLVATDAGDGNGADHADWLDAQIKFVQDATASAE